MDLGNGHSITLWFNNWIDHDLIAPGYLDFQFSIRDLVEDIIHNYCWLTPNHLLLELIAFFHQSSSHILIGGSEVSYTLSWQGDSFGSLSLKYAWNLLRSAAVEVPWAGLIWNKFFCPRLAYFS